MNKKNPTTDGKKKCPKCREIKPLSCFSCIGKFVNGQKRFSSHCIQCKHEYIVERRRMQKKKRLTERTLDPDRKAKIKELSELVKNEIPIPYWEP